MGEHEYTGCIRFGIVDDAGEFRELDNIVGAEGISLSMSEEDKERQQERIDSSWYALREMLGKEYTCEIEFAIPDDYVRIYVPKENAQLVIDDGYMCMPYSADFCITYVPNEKWELLLKYDALNQSMYDRLLKEQLRLLHDNIMKLLYEVIQPPRRIKAIDGVPLYWRRLKHD